MYDRYSPLTSSDGDSRSSRGQGSEESSTSRSRGDLKRFSDGERKVARLTRPRIPKSDFRRNYANMWVNVFNSCDRELMLQHLQQFYHPDVLVRQRDVREGEPHALHVPVRLNTVLANVAVVSCFYS